MNKDKIDIVYLWVDGGDKKWRTQRNFWYKKFYKKDIPNSNESLYRDNGELMYSLRSVDECLKWANHIYIITGFNQKPKWLNTKNKKITIIPHEQIMPKSAIPTFNSSSIEMCITNIPGLSEKFIIMNDDTFFNKKLSPSFFFDKKGRSIVLYNKHKHVLKDVQEWLKSVDIYTSYIISSALKIEEIFGKTILNYRPSHGIDPYTKSSWDECKNHPMVKNIINKQINNKFRIKNELHRWMFNLYDYFSGKAVFKKARGYKSGKHKISNFIYNTLHWKAVRKSPVFCFDAMASQESIKHSPIFCINDSPDNNEQILQNNLNFLQKRFPKKSQFEK